MISKSELEKSEVGGSEMGGSRVRQWALYILLGGLGRHKSCEVKENEV